MIKCKVRISDDFQKDFLKVQEAEYEKVKRALVDKLAQATPVETGRAAAGWQLDGDKITNTVPYIERLNSGHSQQAPSHFVESALLSEEGVHAVGSIVTTL